jgi:hypothetical protein
MIGTVHCLASMLLAVGMLVSGEWSIQAETEVDLALVLAVDVTLSMEAGEQELQRQGFIEAFRTREVQRPSTRECWGASRWCTLNGQVPPIRRSLSPGQESSNPFMRWPLRPILAEAFSTAGLHICFRGYCLQR